MTPTRRSLLGLIVTGTAALVVAPWPGVAASLGPGASRSLFVSSFIGLFSEPLGARKIGRRYLELFPEESDPRTLVANLALKKGVVSADRMRAQLAQARRYDFTAGHTVLIDGWILARSEARACALLAILLRG